MTENVDVTDPLLSKLGVSREVLLPSAQWSWPLHGLRHQDQGDTSGWYCWLGDLSSDPNFFVPLHAAHLVHTWPPIAKYLVRPPGSRFLVAPDYEDLWDDPTLLDV